MNPNNKWLKITGLVLNVLIAAMLISAGAAKLLGRLPPEAVEQMKARGVAEHLQLIACGEIISGILLVIPWTAPLGTLLVSGFWGGAICIHMTHGESYAMPSILLAVTWLGSFLRGSVPLLALPFRPAILPPE